MDTDAPDYFRVRQWWRQWFGSRAESWVAKYLRRLGWRVVGQNERVHGVGEIDLLGLDGQTIVVVEVRSSASQSFEELAASIDVAKQRRLSRAALYFLRRRRLLDIAVRFDVLLLRWPETAATPEVVHHRDAFDVQGVRFQMFD